MNLFLAPHHDDETLFGAYTLLRFRPLVLVCFPGSARFGSTNVRQAETAAAMRILGCEWAPAYEDPDGYVGVLERLDPDRVWAPLPEADGHSDHNAVGETALRLWPDRTTLYATYTLAGGKTESGERVDVEPGWEDLKRRALACYVSQIEHAGTRPHFERSRDEYLADQTLVAA